MIVAGDFNATGNHRPFRRLLSLGGLTDALAESGCGLDTTWPSDMPFPPIARLDHVLVSEEFGIVGSDVVDLAGGDHLAVIADLRVEP